VPTEPQQQEEGTTQMVHTVTFYNNGFTVDDGPLRQQDDPANAPFLQSIEKVRAPSHHGPYHRSSSLRAWLFRDFDFSGISLSRRHWWHGG
jgi:UBX domain-containing protein 1